MTLVARVQAKDNTNVSKLSELPPHLAVVVILANDIHRQEMGLLSQPNGLVNTAAVSTDTASEIWLVIFLSYSYRFQFKSSFWYASDTFVIDSVSVCSRIVFAYTSRTIAVSYEDYHEFRLSWTIRSGQCQKNIHVDLVTPRISKTITSFNKLQSLLKLNRYTRQYGRDQHGQRSWQHRFREPAIGQAITIDAILVPNQWWTRPWINSSKAERSLESNVLEPLLHLGPNS